MFSFQSLNLCNYRATIGAIFVFALCCVSASAQESVHVPLRSFESFVGQSEDLNSGSGLSSEAAEANSPPVPNNLMPHGFRFFPADIGGPDEKTDLPSFDVRTFRNFARSETDEIQTPISNSSSEDGKIAVRRKNVESNCNKFRPKTILTSEDPCSESTGQASIDDEKLDDDPNMPRDLGFRWGPAIRQSLMFLAVQHGFALTTQPRTRKALAEGNFFVDYYQSVRSLHGWDDGGKMFTNYIAHPMQGAMTGFIHVQNDPKGRTQQFGSSREYWRSRTKAFLWAAAWSTQFEIGPLSQASIGNIGLSGKQAWVDIVVTPTFGTGWLIIEDMLDRYVIKKIERKNNFALKLISRIIFNPVRSSANLVRFKQPWYRDRQPGH